MRVRVALAVAVVVVVGTLALELSGRAPRTAGSDHVGTPVFAAAVPGGGTVCQTVAPLPSDAADAQILIGTYGHPVPALSIRFSSASGTSLVEGFLPAGAHEGLVTLPLRRTRAGDASRMCIRVGGHTKVVLAGEARPLDVAVETVNGRPQGGLVGVFYRRRGRESWWELLPVLDTRFGLGKASFMGSWTLPVLALVVLVVWVATIRLLMRELT